MTPDELTDATERFLIEYQDNALGLRFTTDTASQFAYYQGIADVCGVFLGGDIPSSMKKIHDVVLRRTGTRWAPRRDWY